LPTPPAAPRLPCRFDLLLLQRDKFLSIGAIAVSLPTSDPICPRLATGRAQGLPWGDILFSNRLLNNCGAKRYSPQARMTDVIDSKTHAMDGERLKHLFPRRDDIPAEFRPPAPVHQRHVLLDGALVPCSGPCQAVVSPIRFRDPAGALEEIELGSYPEGGEADSEAALGAVPVGNSRSDILVVQPAQNWHGQRLTDGLDGAGDRRVLLQR
jgi:hypothetical protein